MIEALPYRESAAIFGAGPLANLLFWLAVFFLEPFFDPGVSLANPQNQLIATATFSLIAFVIYARKALSAYVVPLLGLATIALVVFALLKFGSQAVGGPVSIVKAAGKSSSNFVSALHFAGFMSLNLALFNALPIYPLDGGKIVDKLVGRLGERTQNIFRMFGIALVLALILGVILSDCFK